jgi:hypothetical protein
MPNGFSLPSALSGVMCLILSLTLSQQVFGQPDANANAPTNEHIYGLWKTGGIQLYCPESEAITQELNTPAVHALTLAQTASVVFDFRPNGDLALNEIVDRTFRISNDSIIFKTQNVEQIEKSYDDSTYTDENWYTLDTTYTYDRFAIARSDEQTLALKQTIHLDDETFSPIGYFVMNAFKELKGKSIEVTTTYKRARFANAPWTKLDFHPSIDSSDMTLTLSGMVLESRCRNLRSINNGTLAFFRKRLKDGYGFVASITEDLNQVDTIYFSSDRGNTWQTRTMGFKRDTINTWVDDDGVTRYETSTNHIKRIQSSKTHFMINSRKNWFYCDNFNGRMIASDELSMAERFKIHGLDSTLVAMVEQKWASRPNQGKYDKPDYTYGDSLIIFSKKNSTNYQYELYACHLNRFDWVKSTIDTKSFPGLWPNRVMILDSAVHVATQYGLFSSTDYGKSWQPNIQSGLIFTIEMSLGESNKGNFIKHDQYWFAGCASGVWFSKDGGVTWLELNNQQLKQGVDSVAIVGDELFALAESGYIWKANLNALLDYAQKE